MAAKKKPAKGKAKSTKSAPKKRSAPDWRPKFLLQLSLTGNITDAARSARIDRKTAYNARDKDEAFAAAMSEAIESAVEDLELEARRRAKDGCERPVFHQGVECGRIREYSDTLMIFLLKAHRPEKYRERASVDVNHSGSIKYEALTDEERAARIAALLDAARARRGAGADGDVAAAPVAPVP